MFLHRGLRKTVEYLQADDSEGLFSEHIGVFMFLFLLWKVSACPFFCAAQRSTDGAAHAPQESRTVYMG